MTEYLSDLVNLWYIQVYITLYPSRPKIRDYSAIRDQVVEKYKNCKLYTPSFLHSKTVCFTSNLLRQFNDQGIESSSVSGDTESNQILNEQKYLQDLLGIFKITKESKLMEMGELYKEFLLIKNNKETESINVYKGKKCINI